MIDIKDIALCNLTNLSEGILDDFETTMAADDKFLDTVEFEKWSKRTVNKAYWRPTKKGWVLQGDFIIDGFKDKKYHGPVIKSIKGNLSIINCELENLEGLFYTDAIIEGTLLIQDCNNLDSLKGCPAEVRTLNLMGNPKLKSLEFAPVITGNLYAMKNGKRFNADKLRDEISVGKRIFCSVEDETPITESLITEAFKNPHFIRLFQQLKEPKYKDWDFRRILKSYDISFDTLDSSSMQEYDGKDPKGLTACRKIMAGASGIILLMDEEGRYTKLIKGHRMTDFTFQDMSSYSRYTWKPSVTGTDTEVYTLERTICNADTIIVISFKYADRTYKLQSDRRAAREGALALQKGEEYDHVDAKILRYYRGIAEENRRRYKNLVNQMKAERALTKNNFDKLKPRVDKAMDRYTALISKMLKEPKKYSTWDINEITSKFKSVTAERYSTKEYGLMPVFDAYVRLCISAASGDEYSNRNFAEKIKEYEEKIEYCLSRIEKKLAELEAK